MDIDRSTDIWNRAATEGGGSTPRPGDAALSSALAFHNMVMSGGIDHAFDVLTSDQIAAAADGYRYLELQPIADLIGHVPAAIADEDDDRIEELDNEYGELVPLDQTLVERFEAALQRSPEDFAPITEVPATPRWGQDSRPQVGPDHLTKPNWLRYGPDRTTVDLRNLIRRMPALAHPLLHRTGDWAEFLTTDGTDATTVVVLGKREK